MKKQIVFILLILAAVPVVYLSSCSKIKEAAAVDVTYKLPRTSFTYTPTSLKASEIVLYTGVVYVNIDSIMKANGISSGSITNAAFTQFSLTLNTPPEANFSWLQSARVVVSQNSSFSPVVEIGNVVNSGGTGKTVTLTVNGANIQPYLSSTGFYIRIYATMTGTFPYSYVTMYMDGQLTISISPV